MPKGGDEIPRADRSVDQRDRQECPLEQIPRVPLQQEQCEHGCTQQGDQKPWVVDVGKSDNHCQIEKQLCARIVH